MLVSDSESPARTTTSPPNDLGPPCTSMAPVIDTCEPSRFTEPPLSSTVSLRASSGPLTASGPVLVMTTAARCAGDVAAAGDGDAVGGDHDGAAGQIARAVAESGGRSIDAQLAGAQGHRAAGVRSSVLTIDSRRVPTSMIDPGVTVCVPLTTQDRPSRAQRSSAVGREGWGPEQQYGERRDGERS